MGKLIIVRHGETEANRGRVVAASGDIPLNETGRQQALESAQRIAKHFHPKRIISSHFLRARQTAEIIAAELQLPAEVWDDIHERELGSLKGEPYTKELELALQDANFDPTKKWNWRPPGGESFEDIRERTASAFERLRARGLLTKKELAASMQRLLDAKRIVVVTVGSKSRQRSHLEVVAKTTLH